MPEKSSFNRNFKISFIIGATVMYFLTAFTNTGDMVTSTLISFFYEDFDKPLKPTLDMDEILETFSENLMKQREEMKLLPQVEIKWVVGATYKYAECRDRGWPAHEVTVSEFYIGKYEVTQKLWKEVMGENNNPSRFKGDDLPVENVSWNDVQEFLGMLNEMTEKFRKRRLEYRLPTEAEWELAARGSYMGRGYRYSGSNNFDEVGWYYENSGDKALDGKDWNSESRARGNLARNNNRTRPAGTKEPNELGIHDMSGNVSEWVGDWYGEYTAVSKEDPTGPETGADRVIRGGSWRSAAGSCGVDYRNSAAPDYRADDVGFRIALGLPLCSLRVYAAKREAAKRKTTDGYFKKRK